VRRLLVVSTFLLAVAGFASIAAARPTSDTASKPVLTIGINRSGTTINPATLGDEAVDDLAYESITHLQPNGQLAPGLAVSWHYVGSGNKTFEFTLRKNARFSDGTPVNAQAVKNWMNYYYFKAKGLQVGDLPVKSVSTSGRYNVILHLAAPNPSAPFLLSEVLGIGFIGGPKGIANPSSLDTGTDGAGPYVADPSQTVSGSQDVFVPNKYFYDQSAIHFSKVVVKYITQATTMLEAIKSGQLDVAMGDPSTAPAAKSAGLNVVSEPGGIDILEILDHGPKTPAGDPNPLFNLKLRQAINYAIDRKTITKAIVGQYGTPTDEYPTTDGYVQSMANYYAYNPAKAKTLLAQAGFPNGVTIGVAGDPNGALGAPTLQAVAQNLQAVGIKLDINQYADLNQWVKDVLADKYPTDTAYEEGFESMAQLYTFNFEPHALLNFGGWSDPVLDKLNAQAVVSKNPGKFFKEMSTRIVTQGYLVPLFIANSYFFTQKDIGGVAYSGPSREPWPAEWYKK